MGHVLWRRAVRAGFLRSGGGDMPGRTLTRVALIGPHSPETRNAQSRKRRKIMDRSRDVASPEGADAELAGGQFCGA
jgi:hypothetical protein